MFWSLNIDMAAKGRKKHKNQISGLINSMGYTRLKFENFDFLRDYQYWNLIFICILKLVIWDLEIIYNGCSNNQQS